MSEVSETLPKVRAKTLPDMAVERAQLRRGQPGGLITRFSPEAYFQGVTEYIDWCSTNGVELTVAGCAIYLGVRADTVYAYKRTPEFEAGTYLLLDSIEGRCEGALMDSGSGSGVKARLYNQFAHRWRETTRIEVETTERREIRILASPGLQARLGIEAEPLTPALDVQNEQPDSDILGLPIKDAVDTPN